MNVIRYHMDENKGEITESVICACIVNTRYILYCTYIRNSSRFVTETFVYLWGISIHANRYWFIATLTTQNEEAVNFGVSNKTLM